MSNYSAYMSLGNYNSFGQAGARGIHPPLPAGTPSMAIQMVPVYGMPGYEALTHDQRNSGEGHFTITDAYPNYGNNCTKFTQRLCAGTVSPSAGPQMKMASSQCGGGSYY